MRAEPKGALEPSLLQTQGPFLSQPRCGPSGRGLQGLI